MARTRPTPTPPLQACDQLSSFELRDSQLPRTVAMDAFRRGDQFVVQLDTPGVDPSSIVITYQRNIVQIRAERRPGYGRGDEVALSECPSGVLTRQLYLDDSLDPRQLTAGYDRGVVTLTIPVVSSASPQQVRVVDQGNSGEQAPILSDLNGHRAPLTSDRADELLAPPSMLGGGTS